MCKEGAHLTSKLGGIVDVDAFVEPRAGMPCSVRFRGEMIEH